MGGASTLPNLLDDLLNDRADDLATGLNDYLETIASYYDTANREISMLENVFRLLGAELLQGEYALRQYPKPPPPAADFVNLCTSWRPLVGNPCIFIPS